MPWACLYLLSFSHTLSFLSLSVFITPLWLLLWCPPFLCFSFALSHPAHLKPTNLLSLSTSAPLFFFPPSPPHPPILPPAGCKMDSPQSESSGEGQKAEENRAQGELQRGRRHSTVLRPLSTFPLLYFWLKNVSPSLLETYFSPSIWIFCSPKKTFALDSCDSWVVNCLSDNAIIPNSVYVLCLRGQTALYLFKSVFTLCLPPTYLTF